MEGFKPLVESHVSGGLAGLSHFSLDSSIQKRFSGPGNLAFSSKLEASPDEVESLQCSNVCFEKKDSAFCSPSGLILLRAILVPTRTHCQMLR